MANSLKQPRSVLLLAAAASGLMLAAALVAQYGFNLHPCELCMAQRYPYAAIILISLAAFFPVPDKTRRLLVFVCAALFVVDGGIAIYHTGVELGWFPAPDACASHSKAGQTLEEMRAELMGAPLVTCDQAMGHIFGLSLAAWNAMAAFAFAVATLLLARKSK